MLQNAQGSSSITWLHRRLTSSYVPPTHTTLGSKTPAAASLSPPVSSGTNTQPPTPPSPARAAYAATELARLPVEAQPIVSKPWARAHDTATDTTRSLNELVGFMLSFLTYRLRRPSSAPSRSALTSGV